jgi:hypothetical protein
MLGKKQKGDETISKTVRDHSRDKALSPKRHDGQYDPYEQNRHQSDAALVEMSLRKDDYLQGGGENRASAQSLALSLNGNRGRQILRRSRL